MNSSSSFGTQHPIVPAILHQDELCRQLSLKFDVAEKEMVVAGTRFSILKVRDTNMLVDAIDPATFEGDERLPYWADIWTSSLELARWCLEDADLNGKRVLELGCGLGFAGIAAAKAGAIITLSDYEQDALDFARVNAFRNLPEEIISSRVAFLRLDWRELPEIQKFDMILAADVVYERRCFFPLIEAMTTMLAPDGCALFTEPGRSIGEHFFRLLREEGFHLTTTTRSVQVDGKKTGVIRALITCPAPAGSLRP